MRQGFSAAVLAFALLTTPALAEGPAASDKDLGAEIDEAVKEALRALELFFDRFPGYEAPEVTPEGDIIIRKKRPRPEPPPAPDRRKI